MFDIECLLQCVLHYAIGDQEFSSSAAFTASENTAKPQPHLVLYEDVLQDQVLASRQVFGYIGIPVPEGANFFEDSAEQKIHSDDICTYSDVDCSKLTPKLNKDYPCLSKQLKSSGTTAWSVPMEGGRISLKGDCSKLASLGDSHMDRKFEELYIPSRTIF